MWGDGFIALPMSSMSGQFNNDFDRTNVTHLILCTNTLFNWGWSFQIGEIGFYNGDPSNASSVFTKIFTLESKAKYSKFLLWGGYCSQQRIEPVATEYPFKKSLAAFNNTAIFKGRDTQGPQDGTVEMYIDFDEPYNITSSAYLAFQFKAITGVPGIAFGLVSKTGDVTSIASTINMDGSPAYIMRTDGSIEQSSILYGHLNFDGERRGNSTVIIYKKFDRNVR